MFWLVSRFSKIKNPNSQFLGNQCGIAGVCIFDMTPASMRVHHSKVLHSLVVVAITGNSIGTDDDDDDNNDDTL